MPHPINTRSNIPAIYHIDNTAGRQNNELTPLHFAVLSPERNDMVEVILQEIQVIVDLRDNYGMTPLAYAAMVGNYDAAKALLERGAHPDGIDWDELGDDVDVSLNGIVDKRIRAAAPAAPPALAAPAPAPVAAAPPPQLQYLSGNFTGNPTITDIMVSSHATVVRRQLSLRRIER